MTKLWVSSEFFLCEQLGSNNHKGVERLFSFCLFFLFLYKNVTTFKEYNFDKRLYSSQSVRGKKDIAKTE